MKNSSSKASPAKMKTAATPRTKPAPAEKTPAVKKTAARKTPSAVKRASSAKPKSAATESATATETVIIARADVGFGNELFLRGNGPGLSWDRGILLACTDSDCWSWRSTDAKVPFEFKILLNDEQWSTGENWPISPGEKKEVAPEF